MSKDEIIVDLPMIKAVHDLDRPIYPTDVYSFISGQVTTYGVTGGLL